MYAKGCSLSSRVDTKVHAFPSYAPHCGGDRPQPHSGLPQRPTFPMNELAGKPERVAGIMPSRLLLDTLKFTICTPVMIGRFPVNSLFSKKSPVSCFRLLIAKGIEPVKLFLERSNRFKWANSVRLRGNSPKNRLVLR